MAHNPGAFKALLSLSFRSYLSTMGGGMKANNGKQRKTGVVGLVLLTAVSLFVALTYSASFGFAIVAGGGQLALVPIILGLFSVFFSFMFTITAASGVLFGGRDMDLLFSLPVSPFSILLSKLLAMYLEDLLVSACFMLPAGATYLLLGGPLSAGFVLGLLLATVLLPCVSELLAMIVGFLFSFVSGHMKHNNLISSVLYLLFFGVVMVGSMQIGNFTATLMENTGGLIAVLNSYLLPFGLLLSALNGNLLSLLCFVLIIAVPFLLVCWLISLCYRKIVLSASARGTGKRYHFTRVNQTGVFSALYKRETARLFGTPVYLLNTVIMGLLFIGFAVYSLFDAEMSSLFTTAIGVSEEISLFIVSLILLIPAATVNTTSVSISLEGKNFWILREAPISARQLFGAKILTNLTVAWPIVIAGDLVIGLGSHQPVGTMISLILLGLALTLFNAVLGLQYNLWMPKMNGSNDTQVIKQSGSAMLGIFGGMVLGFVVALLWLPAAPVMSYPVFAAIMTVVLLIATALVWHRMDKKGERILLNLTARTN